MKFKTFRGLFVVGALAAAGAVIFLAGRGCSKSTGKQEAHKSSPTPQPTAEPQPTPQPTAEPQPQVAAANALRPLDEAILARVRQGISGDKVKDAIPGAWKVNLYKDAGKSGVN